MFFNATLCNQGGPDDVANIVASLPEDIREEVLLYSGPDILANLPPDLIAEGQRLRDRHMQHADHEDAMARNFFFRRLRQDRDQVRCGFLFNNFSICFRRFAQKLNCVISSSDACTWDQSWSKWRSWGKKR